MGNSAVAVLHYDHAGEIKQQSPRMWEAMRDFNDPRQPLRGYFGFGQVVSWDHSSGYQVCVIHGNTGWRIGRDEEPPPDEVLTACANALRAHGWSVEKPRRQRITP